MLGAKCIRLLEQSSLDLREELPGSACHAGEVTLSPVLRAMGVHPDEGMGAVRFSLGRATTADEIDAVVADLARILPKAM